MEKLSSTKPVPGAKNVGDHCYRSTLEGPLTNSFGEKSILLWHLACLTRFQESHAHVR